MPDISKITLPSGNTYDLKDATARSQIAALAGGDAIIFVGVSTTPLTDGGSETPTVGGEQKTPSTGHLFFYGTQEYIWGDDGKWHALGSLDSLGDLAYKDSASGQYKPKGSVSTPTFTGNQSSVTLNIEESNEGNYTPEGTITTPTFTGTSTTFSGNFTPHGTISTTIATNTSTTIDVNSATGTGSTTYTPHGTVSTPTITLATAGTTKTVKNPSSTTVVKTVIATAPGDQTPSHAIPYYSVTGETLSLYQLGYTTGASITTSDLQVKTGDASYSCSTPSFTGTGVALHAQVRIPATFTSVFTGTEESVKTTGLPKGSVSTPIFTGTKVAITGTTTAEGSVSQPTFSGTQETITVS